jgi:hypothetical protein
VLHPRHKLQYFKNAGWESDWIQTATDLVHDEFDLSYADIPIGTGNASGSVDESESAQGPKVRCCFIVQFL